MYDCNELFLPREDLLSSQPIPHLEVIAAEQADQATISNLIQLYLYDMASAVPFPVGADGKYAYTMMDAFWEHPYLLKVDGEIAGFVLVINRCPITKTSPCWFMAEFFVMRPYRRKSIGKDAFAELRARHPGLWHVATVTHNKKGEAFWATVIPDNRCEKQDIRFDEMNWVVRSFQAGA